MTRNRNNGVKRNRTPPLTTVKEGRNEPNLSSSATAVANVSQSLESNDFDSNINSDGTTSSVHSISNSVSRQKSTNGDQKYTTAKIKFQGK